MTVGEWVHVADVEDVAPGEGLCVEVEDSTVAVWNVDGEFYATQDSCTHEETSLADGDLWGEVIECPLHGAQFDVRTGAVLSLPALFPLATYPTRVEDGRVYIQWTSGIR